MRETKGFTLIELLIVIAIIGVLSSIVVVSLNKARARGKDAKATMELRQIEVAAMMDFEDYGNYAPDVTAGVNPRFVPTYMSTYDATYYCGTCLYDWQNWAPSCILVELYETDTGPVLRRRCIETSGCGGGWTCTNL